MPKLILHTALFYYPHQFSALLAHANGNFHLLGANHSSRLFVKFYGRLIWLRLSAQSLAKWQKVVLVSSISLLPLALMSTLFLIPKNTVINFAETNCLSNPVIFPNLPTQTFSQSYKISHKPSLSVAGYPLLSTSSCIEIQSAPVAQTEQKVSLSILGLNNNIYIKTPTLPALEVETDLSQPVSPLNDIEFELDKPDRTFSYNVKVNEQTQSCNISDTSVMCSLRDVKLAQGETYKMEVSQHFNNEGSTLFSHDITLRDPVIFSEPSIAPSQIVYDKPQSLTIKTNKPISNAGKVELKNDEQVLASTTEITDEGLKINIAEDLPRQATINLSISGSEAEDGAYLPEPYNLEFITSGGPKVTSINIGSYDVNIAKSIIINFDSPPSNVELDKYVDLKIGSQNQTANISVSGNSIIINPTANLPACTGFNISVRDGLSNIYGISGGSNWSFNSKTTCKQIFSIGASIQGRSLTAYKFGSGSTKILFVGGIHGNERSSYRTLIAWVDELERRYDQIPSDKSVIVIPDINPDGYALSSRTNANGIDLNRNFPSNDWTSAVYMPGGVFSETGGGNSPLSEPESATLASYINSLQPRLVLTYHAVARTVIDNGAGDSSGIANIYATNSNFAHYGQSHEDGIFNYPTTGEFETWLADKKNIPTLLVELATMSSNEINSQRAAMWAMLGI